MSEFFDKAPKKIQHLIEKIRKDTKGSIYEGCTYLVGGAVRDIIMGKTDDIKDIDIAIEYPNGGVGFSLFITNLNDCLKVDSNPCLFERFGTSKFNLLNDEELKDIQIECVQTRKEKYDKISRNPSVVYGDIEDDCHRRDFTINALYYDIENDKLMDLTEKGISDIDNKMLRCTGKADEIFEDDPLRILRAIRFQSRFGFGISKDTWLGMILNAEKVKALTKERIHTEIDKILLSDKPSEAFIKMSQCGLLKHIFPDIEETKHVYQDLRPTRTVFEHTMAAIDATPKMLETRMAALLHDIGKNETYKNHFMFHTKAGADMAEKILKEYNYSNAFIKKVKTAIEHHDDFSSYSTSSAPREAIIRKFYDELDSDDELVEITLDLMHANNVSQLYGKKAKFVKNFKDKIEALKKKNENRNILMIKPPLSPIDIMNEFKIKPSPLLGNIVKHLRSKMIEEPNLSKEQAIKLVEEYLKTKNAG